jgi:hypothetical protein
VGEEYEHPFTFSTNKMLEQEGGGRQRVFTEARRNGGNGVSVPHSKNKRSPE